MSRQSFTPGPWVAQLYTGNRFDGLPYAQWEIFADDQPGTYIASANEDNDDAAANARLIAAAPKLLAAAHLALANLMRNLASEEACGDPFMGDDDHEAISVLRTAIASATGEQP